MFRGHFMHSVDAKGRISLPARFRELIAANGDQRIDFTEFSQLLENLGSEVPPERRRARFNELDTDRDGAIDRREFMEWWRSV